MKEKQVEKTFEDLQKPTMELIASFYKMSEKTTGLFSDTMALYEANPTEENAKIISDKIMDRKTSQEDKEAWIQEQVSNVSLSVRRQAKKKYVDGRKSVPMGMPTSGMFLSGMGIVSQKEKDVLMEAQAAARICATIDGVSFSDKIEKECPYECKDGEFIRNTHLEKPFATEMQLTENIVSGIVYKAEKDAKKATSGYPYEYGSAGAVEYEYERENILKQDSFVQKARYTAVETLDKCADALKEKNPQAAQKIGELTKALKADIPTAEDLKTIDDAVLAAKKVNDLGKKLGKNGIDEGVDVAFNSLSCAANKVRCVVENQSHLRAADYQRLASVNYENKDLNNLIKHRAEQVLYKQQEKQKQMASLNTRGESR